MFDDYDDNAVSDLLPWRIRRIFWIVFVLLSCYLMYAMVAFNEAERDQREQRYSEAMTRQAPETTLVPTRTPVVFPWPPIVSPPMLIPTVLPPTVTPIVPGRM